MYAAFTYAVFVWGWHEMAFFMGFITGPRRTACPAGAAGWRRFGLAVQACIDHELAILATGVAVLWATWHAPNQVGLWTFLALWGMRLSAKLNVFLGVLNLGEAFLPAHLAYLLSYMRRRRMNALMPVSLAGGGPAGGGAGARRACNAWAGVRGDHAGVGGAGACDAGGACAVRGVVGMVVKHSFFEKKEQKTFAHCGARLPHPPPKRTKVFWFFSSEKNRLTCL